MKFAHDIIIRPVLTEKSYDNMANKTYAFTKTEVKSAIEEIFGVQVDSVNTVNNLGKMKRQGLHQGRRPATKKAYVKLKKDSKGIEFFDSIAQ